MQRFSTFSDAALLERIERLDSAEHELHQAAVNRALQAELHGRAPKGSLRYAGLLAALEDVREDIQRTEAEFLRRGAYARQAVA
jgi:hypothetical protein